MLNHVNKHPPIYSIQKHKQQYMLEQKQKKIKAFKCEAYIKTEKVWCSQTFSSSRRYDRLLWGQNTLELPKMLDPIECKNMIRYLHATDNNELNNYNIQSSFSFFDDSGYQSKIEQFQQPFRVKRLNALISERSYMMNLIQTG